MAATNPMRTSDLVAKFGWQAMIYLANLGIENLAEVQVLFVDSAHTNALDADDGEHGLSFTRPLATWDYAVGLCTAGERSIILLAPTHNEVLAAAQVDIDVTDVQTIGIGSGLARPTIDFDNAASSIDVGANNCSLQNVNILPSVELILIGVHVETDVIGFRMKDVDFLIGEDDGGVDEFVKAVELTSGNDDTVFENVKILTHASCGGATHGIHIAAASDRLTFKNVVMDGPMATGGIVETATGVNHIVENCSIDTSGTNYSFEASSTFAKYTNNVDAGVDSEDAEALIEVARGVGNFPTGITDNSILAYLMGKGGTASADTYINTTDSLEAISDKITAIDNTTNLNTAVPAVPTTRALQDILEKDGNSNWDQTVHSLEAIGDDLALGTGCTTAIEADLLEKLVAASDTDQAYPNSVVSHSVIADILSATGVASTFDRASDSLEAIADAIAAYTDNVAVAVPNVAVARSLQDILNKNDTGGFDDTTDSLEAIRDHLDGTTVLGGIQLDHLMQTDTGVGAGADLTTFTADGSLLAHIISATANTSTYDCQTDSLEAIRDNQQTAARAAIDDAELGYLLEIDGATQVYPENCVTDSIIAKIIATDADPSTYNSTTDSLEAISDFVRTGTTLGRGINLDYFMKTAAASGADLTTEVPDGSVLSHILDDGGDTSAYDQTKHSLFAIGADTDSIITNIATAQTELNKIGTISNAGGTAELGAALGPFANITLVARLDLVQAEVDKVDSGAMTAAPTSGSLGSFIGGGGTGLGTRLADSKSIIDALGHTGSAFSGTDGLGYWLEKTIKKTGAVADLDDLFTVSGGDILIKSLVGIVTTQIGATQTRIKIVVDSTSTTDDRDFSTQVDLTGNTVGTIYVFSAVNPAVLTPLTTGATGGGNLQVPWFCVEGVIEQVNADDLDTGAIDWYLTYIPLEAGVTVTAA